MTKLIGRNSERFQLDQALEKALIGQPQFVVLFGRRRVGKTYLLRDILDGQKVPSIYFAALRGRSNEAERFASLAGKVLGRAFPNDWAEIFQALVDESRTKPVIVAIDEAPYLIDGDPSWTSAIQHAWDSTQENGSAQFFLCLTGSAVTTLSKVISSGGPLFGRSTLRVRLDPFDLPMAHELMGPDGDPKTTIEALAACGGYPLLLKEWDRNEPAQRNLEVLAGSALAPLAVDANALLLDLPDPSGYRRVLSSIGRRRSKRSEINTEIGQRTDRALGILEQTGLIRRVYPIDDGSFKLLTYQLADHYLSFWFRLVDPNQQEIDSGQGVAALRRSTETWNHHVEAVFEQEAREHCARLVARNEIEAGIVGRWWTARPRQAELDVVVVDKHWNLVGEAKWKDRFGMIDWRAFTRNIEATGDRATGCTRALWIKNSVDPTVLAIDPHLRVFRAEDMVR